MTQAAKDLVTSVRARLRKLSIERNEDHQLLLVRYANERLLHRIAVSPHASKFVLKGAALFTVWTGRAHRATRDIDLLGFGDGAESNVRKVFTEILQLSVEDDAVLFDVASLDVHPIREDQEYGGVRVIIRARVGNAKLRLQVDVGFGDIITPHAEIVEFPALLDFPAPRLRAYPKETVVAEKLDALVQLGMANSRMKDLFDMIVLSRMFDFDGKSLVQAIRATFERRATRLPRGLPVALTDEFAADAIKNTQWTAFCTNPVRQRRWAVCPLSSWSLGGLLRNRLLRPPPRPRSARIGAEAVPGHGPVHSSIQAAGPHGNARRSRSG